MIARLRNLLGPLTRHWLWVALIVSIAMLAIAHGSERFLDLQPCELCYRQRKPYWFVGAVSLGGILGGLTPWKSWIQRLALSVIAVAFAYGVYLSGWHTGVELGWWEGPPQCATARGPAQISVETIREMMSGKGGFALPSCEDPTPFLGLTMASWNLIASIVLTLWSAVAAVRAPRR